MTTKRSRQTATQTLRQSQPDVRKLIIHQKKGVRRKSVLQLLRELRGGT